MILPGSNSHRCSSLRMQDLEGAVGAHQRLLLVSEVRNRAGVGSEAAVPVKRRFGASQTSLDRIPGKWIEGDSWGISDALMEPGHPGFLDCSSGGAGGFRQQFGTATLIFYEGRLKLGFFHT